MSKISSQRNFIGKIDEKEWLRIMTGRNTEDLGKWLAKTIEKHIWEEWLRGVAGNNDWKKNGQRKMTKL